MPRALSKRSRLRRSHAVQAQQTRAQQLVLPEQKELEQFYAVVDPTKIQHVGSILGSHKDDPGRLFARLQHKYNTPKHTAALEKLRSSSREGGGEDGGGRGLTPPPGSQEEDAGKLAEGAITAAAPQKTAATATLARPAAGRPTPTAGTATGATEAEADAEAEAQSRLLMHERRRAREELGAQKVVSPEQKRRDGEEAKAIIRTYQAEAALADKQLEEERERQRLKHEQRMRKRKAKTDTERLRAVRAASDVEAAKNEDEARQKRRDVEEAKAIIRTHEAEVALASKKLEEEREQQRVKHEQRMRKRKEAKNATMGGGKTPVENVGEKGKDRFPPVAVAADGNNDGDGDGDGDGGGGAKHNLKQSQLGTSARALARFSGRRIHAESFVQTPFNSTRQSPLRSSQIDAWAKEAPEEHDELLRRRTVYGDGNEESPRRNSRELFFAPAFSSRFPPQAGPGPSRPEPAKVKPEGMPARIESAKVKPVSDEAGLLKGEAAAAAAATTTTNPEPTKVMRPRARRRPTLKRASVLVRDAKAALIAQRRRNGVKKNPIRQKKGKKKKRGKRKTGEDWLLDIIEREEADEEKRQAARRAEQLAAEQRAEKRGSYSYVSNSTRFISYLNSSNGTETSGMDGPRRRRRRMGAAAAAGEDQVPTSLALSLEAHIYNVYTGPYKARMQTAFGAYVMLPCPDSDSSSATSTSASSALGNNTAAAAAGAAGAVWGQVVGRKEGLSGARVFVVACCVPEVGTKAAAMAAHGMREGGVPHRMSRRILKYMDLLDATRQAAFAWEQGKRPPKLLLGAKTVDVAAEMGIVLPAQSQSTAPAPAVQPKPKPSTASKPSMAMSTAASDSRSRPRRQRPREREESVLAGRSSRRRLREDGAGRRRGQGGAADDRPRQDHHYHGGGLGVLGTVELAARHHRRHVTEMRQESDALHALEHGEGEMPQFGRRRHVVAVASSSSSSSSPVFHQESFPETAIRTPHDSRGGFGGGGGRLGAGVADGGYGYPRRTKPGRASTFEPHAKTTAQSRPHHPSRRDEGGGYDYGRRYEYHDDDKAYYDGRGSDAAGRGGSRPWHGRGRSALALAVDEADEQDRRREVRDDEYRLRRPDVLRRRPHSSRRRLQGRPPAPVMLRNGEYEHGHGHGYSHQHSHELSHEVQRSRVLQRRPSSYHGRHGPGSFRKLRRHSIGGSFVGKRGGTSGPGAGAGAGGGLTRTPGRASDDLDDRSYQYDEYSSRSESSSPYRDDGRHRLERREYEKTRDVGRRRHEQRPSYEEYQYGSPPPESESRRRRQGDLGERRGDALDRAQRRQDRGRRLFERGMTARFALEDSSYYED